MPIKYKYDESSNVVYTYGIGEVTYYDLKDYFEKILLDSAVQSGFWEIVNTCDVINVTITLEDCMKLLTLIKRFVKEKQYKGAILFAPNKHSISVIRLWFYFLRKFLTEQFFIESKLKDYQKLVLRHTGVVYQLDSWRDHE
ncbi:MAG: hypothetical protein OEZ39_09280 [Gammaproteobacteria bacterium]|nr:hypothetical protein [Gammaproteobacteria bacterium]MDH5652036.1 hypothetical protein [Gammaproteobacteria bacterium]